MIYVSHFLQMYQLRDGHMVSPYLLWLAYQHVDIGTFPINCVTYALTSLAEYRQKTFSEEHFPILFWKFDDRYPRFRSLSPALLKITAAEQDQLDCGLGRLQRNSQANVNWTNKDINQQTNKQNWSDLAETSKVIAARNFVTEKQWQTKQKFSGV